MSFFKNNENHILNYEECKNIYRNATMGKRVVEGLVNFAMSAERDIDVQKAPPEAVQKFKDTAKTLKQEEAIKKTIYNARIYGTGGLYVAMYNEEEEKDDFTTKPTFEDAYKYKIRFNVLDPLNLSGSRVDTDPLSFHFLELVDIKVNTKTVPRKRISISHALEPLYLDTRTSLLPFTPPSVFYNMIDLLKEYDDAIKSIGDLLYKAGAIVYKYPAKSKLNGVFVDAQERSQIILQQKQSGEVISISADSSLEDFPISNLSGLIEAVNKLEDDITKALNDTPASILFDKSLSNGFSEGDKDKETEISIIESFRENKLTPLYELTDYYVMLKAWDSNFIDEMRSIYSNYEDKSDIEIFRDWAESFTFKYGNLFPEPESLIQENNAKKLDNLLKAQQLGANIADIEEELNESEIFRNEMSLDNPPQMEEGDTEEEDDTALDQYGNQDAWSIYGKEFEEYKKDLKRQETEYYQNRAIGDSQIQTDSMPTIKIDDSDFKEEEHPRNPDGTFKKGAGSSVSSKQMEMIEEFIKSKGYAGKTAELVKEKLIKQFEGNKKKQQEKKEKEEKKKEKDLKKKEKLLKQDFYKDKKEYNQYLNDYEDSQNKIKEQYEEYGLKEGNEEKSLKKEIDKWHNALKEQIHIKIGSLEKASSVDRYGLKDTGTKIVKDVKYYDAKIKQAYDNLDKLKTELKDKQNKKIEEAKKNKQNKSNDDVEKQNKNKEVSKSKEEDIDEQIEHLKTLGCSDEMAKKIKDHLMQKNKQENNNQDNNVEKQNKENNDNNAEGYKKNVQALPEDLRDIGEKLYSGKYKGGELVKGATFRDNVNQNKFSKKMNELSELEAAIFAYTYNETYKLKDEQLEKIAELIYNSPTVNEPLYRGQHGYELQNLKVGDDMPMSKINSFSSSEDTAENFASNKGGNYPTIIVINKPCKALNIQPLSFYASSEDEYFVGDGYIVDDIKEEPYQGVKLKTITIKPKKEIE